MRLKYLWCAKFRQDKENSRLEKKKQKKTGNLQRITASTLGKKAFVAPSTFPSEK